MFSLIKKDFITTLRINSIMFIIITILVALFLSIFAGPLLFTILPIFLSIVIVNNTFEYDSYDESDSFMMSLPVKREDVVYSKYIFSLMIIFINLIIVYLISELILSKVGEFMVLQDFTFTLNVFLLAISIIIPIRLNSSKLISKYIAYVLAVIVEIPLMSLINTIGRRIGNAGENATVTFSSVGGINFSEFYYNHINLQYINFTTVTIFIVVLFLVSMFISIKVYSNKQLS